MKVIMSEVKNARFLQTIWREPVDMTPIWIMRQAGRYLPEYRAVRQKAGSFMALCKTPDLACEVTLQPLRRFPLDAAILFSDILTIPDAMGLGLEFVEGQGPRFERPIRRQEDVGRLAVPDRALLGYVYDAIRLVKDELESSGTPLIGFCGSPWTLAAYMVEGRSRPGFPLLLRMCAEEPLLVHQLLKVLAEAVCAHLNAQIEAGVSAVMLFDTWGGLLPLDQYHVFSLQYLRHVLAGLHGPYQGKKIPAIIYAKGGSAWLEDLACLGCHVIGVDWTVSLQEARERVGGKVALQGNLDPSLLLLPPDALRQEVKKVLSSYGEGPGHIFNLGHGITPDVPPDHVAVLVDAVHELSRAYHVS